MVPLKLSINLLSGLHGYTNKRQIQYRSPSLQVSHCVWCPVAIATCVDIFLSIHECTCTCRVSFRILLKEGKIRYYSIVEGKDLSIATYTIAGVNKDLQCNMLLFQYRYHCAIQASLYYHFTPVLFINWQFAHQLAICSSITPIRQTNCSSILHHILVIT